MSDMGFLGRKNRQDTSSAHVSSLIQDLARVRDDLLRFNAAKSALIELGIAAQGALVAALHDTSNDQAIRVNVATILGEIDTPDAVSALIKASGDSDWMVRSQAVRAVGASGDHRVPGVLEEMIRDSHHVVRGSVAQVLPIARHPEAEKLWPQLLGDRDRNVQFAALQSLSMSEHPPSSEAVVPAIVGILETLTHLDEDADICRRAIDALGTLLATRELVDTLSRDNWRARSMAARKLGEMGSDGSEIETSAVQALIDALQDDSDSVRMSAAQALKTIGGPEADAALADYRPV